MSEPGGKTYRPWEPAALSQEGIAQRPSCLRANVVFFLLDIVPRWTCSASTHPMRRKPVARRRLTQHDGRPVALWPTVWGCFRAADRLGLRAQPRLIAIVGQDRPDFRTISDFRKLHLEVFKDVLCRGSVWQGGRGWCNERNVSTDGTQIQGNASRHKAMSYGYRKKEVEALARGH